ncbi:MAG: hypothetical protein Q6L49_02710 [Thermostichales cyanobacterium HHBFW_bins_127]
MLLTQPRPAGEVYVAAGAHLAAGVILYAQAGSRIEIHSGADIGENCILHACRGSLVIGAGVSLGSRVLIVGAGTIGDQADIGERSTLIDPDIASQTVVPPGSLIGDRSRRVDDPVLYQSLTATAATPAKDAELTEPPRPAQPLSPTQQVQRQASNGRPVPGHASLQQLLRKIYPHRSET